MLIVKMLQTKPIAVGVRVRPALFLAVPTAYRACLFAMGFNTALMDQTKLDVRLKMAKVRKEYGIVAIYLESSINVKRLYRFPISECPGNGFKCNDGTCVPEHSFCNSIFDCSDGSDEPEQSCKREYRKKKSGEYCPLQCGNGRCRSAAVIINKNFLCLFIQSANVISIMFRFQGSLYRSRRLW